MSQNTIPPGTTAALRQDVALLNAIVGVSDALLLVAKAMPPDKLAAVEPALSAMTGAVQDAAETLAARVRALEGEHGKG